MSETFHFCLERQNNCNKKGQYIYLLTNRSLTYREACQTVWLFHKQITQYDQLIFKILYYVFKNKNPAVMLRILSYFSNV